MRICLTVSVDFVQFGPETPGEWLEYYYRTVASSRSPPDESDCVSKIIFPRNRGEQKNRKSRFWFLETPPDRINMHT